MTQSNTKPSSHVYAISVNKCTKNNDICFSFFHFFSPVRYTCIGTVNILSFFLNLSGLLSKKAQLDSKTKWQLGLFVGLVSGSYS